MSLRTLLRDLLGRERDPAPVTSAAAAGGAAVAPIGVRAPPPRPTVATRRKQQNREAFEERLRALAPPPAGGARTPIVAGRLQMIALSRVKAQLGERWPRFADKAHARAQRVLERRLADEDVYMQVADGGYMVLFATLSGEEATFKAQAIAREIVAHLLGELPAEMKDLPVDVVVHEIGADELGGTPDLDALVVAFDKRDARGVGGTRPPDGGAAAAAAEPLPPDPEATGHLDFFYLPVWSRRGGAIVLYNCVPVWRSDAGGGCGGGRIHPPESRLAIHDLDGATLRAVLAALETMQSEGRTALVLAPVHWETLAQLRTRRAYLDLCHRIPPDLMRQLGLLVTGIPPGVWRTPLSDHLAPLHPFVRLLVARVEPHPSQVWKFAGTGVQAFSFDAAGLNPADTVRYGLIEAFIRRAHAQHFAVGVLWVGDRTAARALLAAKVDFLAGDAVAPPVEAPGAAYRLALAV